MLVLVLVIVLVMAMAVLRLLPLFLLLLLLPLFLLMLRLLTARVLRRSVRRDGSEFTGLPPATSHAIVNAYALAFFNRHLRGEEDEGGWLQRSHYVRPNRRRCYSCP